MSRARLGLLCLLLILTVGAPAAHAFRYRTVRLAKSNGFSEPRVAVDNHGRFWLESNAANGSAAVWDSMRGLSWGETPAEPPGQARTPAGSAWRAPRPRGRPRSGTR